MTGSSFVFSKTVTKADIKLKTKYTNVGPLTSLRSPGEEEAARTCHVIPATESSSVVSEIVMKVMEVRLGTVQISPGTFTIYQCSKCSNEEEAAITQNIVIE